MIERKAVRVFPEPVGEEMRTLRRAWMSGTAYACGSVIPENFPVNQVRRRGSRRPRTSSLEYTLLTFVTISGTAMNHGVSRGGLKDFCGGSGEPTVPCARSRRGMPK